MIGDLEKNLREKILFFSWILFFIGAFFNYLLYFSFKDFLSFSFFLNSLINLSSDLFFLIFFIFLFLSFKTGLKLSHEGLVLFFALLFYLILSFSSTFWSVFPGTTFWKSFNLLILSFPPLFTSLNFSKPKFLLNSFGTLLSFLSIFTIFCNFILQILVKNHLYLFGNPNPFGFWLFLTSAITFFLYFFNSKKYFFFFFLIQIFTLMSTFSRGSLLGVMGFFLCFFFLLWQKRRELLKPFLLKTLPLFFILGITSILISPQGWLTKFKLGMNKRIEIWKEGFALWKEKPFLGHGFGASDFLLFQRIIPPPFSYPSFHNVFFETLADLGIVGLLILVFFWFFAIKFGIKKLKMAKAEEEILPLIFLLSLQGGIFLNSLFESHIAPQALSFLYSLWIFFTSFLLNPNLYKRE